ncbi:MAG: hypothetical protein K2N24_11100 [Lachnospiraceae bacterium]|nr:hypothetical protein [Lachnospiraceae bacterium]
MNMTTKLKERFCKDCNIPLRLFQEPYFTERLRDCWHSLWKCRISNCRI